MRARRLAAPGVSNYRAAMRVLEAAAPVTIDLVVRGPARLC
jgi:hypothetical protein